MLHKIKREYRKFKPMALEKPAAAMIFVAMKVLFDFIVTGFCSEALGFVGTFGGFT